MDYPYEASKLSNTAAATTCLEVILIVKLECDINCVRRMTQNAYMRALSNHCQSTSEWRWYVLRGAPSYWRYSSTHPPCRLKRRIGNAKYVGTSGAERNNNTMLICWILFEETSIENWVMCLQSRIEILIFFCCDSF